MFLRLLMLDNSTLNIYWEIEIRRRIKCESSESIDLQNKVNKCFIPLAMVNLISKIMREKGLIDLLGGFVGVRIRSVR